MNGHRGKPLWLFIFPAKGAKMEIFSASEALEKDLEELLHRVTNNKALYPMLVLTYLPKLDISMEDDYLEVLNEFILHTLEEAYEYDGASDRDERISEGIDFASYIISIMVYIRYVAACNSVYLDYKAVPDELFFNPYAYDPDLEQSSLALNSIMQMRRYHPLRKWHKVSVVRKIEPQSMGNVLSMQYQLCWKALLAHVSEYSIAFTFDVFKEKLLENLDRRIAVFEPQGLTIVRKVSIKTALSSLSVSQAIPVRQCQLEFGFETSHHPDANMFMSVLEKL